MASSEWNFAFRHSLFASARRSVCSQASQARPETTGAGVKCTVTGIPELFYRYDIGAKGEARARVYENGHVAFSRRATPICTEESGMPNLVNSVGTRILPNAPMAAACQHAKAGPWSVLPERKAEAKLAFSIVHTREAYDSDHRVGIQISTRDMSPRQYYIMITRDGWGLFGFILALQTTTQADGTILHRLTGQRGDLESGVRRARPTFPEFVSEDEIFNYLRDGLEQLLRESEFRTAISANQKLEFELR